MEHYAHSENDCGCRELLRDHLQHVAERAAEYAATIAASEEARAAGLLHDLGKYGELFGRRLEAPAQVMGVDHWSPGAAAARVRYGKRDPHLPVALECVIAGHHVGLKQAVQPLRTDTQASLRNAATSLTVYAQQLGAPNAVAFHERFQKENPKLPALKQSIYAAGDPHAVAGMLDLRMLFSALVDADYIETEAHFQGTVEQPRVYRKPGPNLQAKEAFQLVVDYVRERRRTVRDERGASDETIALRDELLDLCLAAAEGGRGIYTLTAPTGAGKTLAMLAFALKHARIHSGEKPIRRVVAVIPFLTIIEQTASEYRKIFEPHFGRDYVIEDHSQAGTSVRGVQTEAAQVPPRELSVRDDGVTARDRQRLLAENYDAPLIVATSVQVLESLFASRPRACRKLHHLANSVLLFDEVQTLPPPLAIVTLAAVSRLVERYGCTAVFATATQPAFEHLHNEVAAQCKRGWQPDDEIVHQTARFFARVAHRTDVTWRLHEPISWQDLAWELARKEIDQVLCVVNLKRHAIELVEGLRKLRIADGLLHLSTNLCPAHREAVLREVRRRLDQKMPCRLIATQCIEAGVDVDFPAVYRALGPLDAIIQAAGRCNRGGMHPIPGRVVVFVPQRQREDEKLYPPGYGEAAEHTRAFVLQRISRDGPDQAKKLIHEPKVIQDYFRSFYDLSGNTRVPNDISDALDARDFQRVAEAYRLIASTKRYFVGLALTSAADRDILP